MPNDLQKKDVSKQIEAKLLDLSNVPYVSPEEVANVVIPIAKSVGDLRKEVAKNKTEIIEDINFVDKRVDGVIDAVDENLGKLDKEIAAIKNKPKEWVSKKEVEKIVKEKLPEPADLDPLYEKLKQVEAKIKPFPKQEVPPEVWKEFDAIEDEIEKLKKEISKKNGNSYSLFPDRGFSGRLDTWKNGSGQTMGTISVSATAPENPAVNDLWVQT